MIQAKIRIPLLLVLLLVGCWQLPAIAESPPELVFNTQDFRPFSYEENGEVAGPAAEIIRKICQEIKVSCSLKLLPWARAQQQVQSGTAHAMFVIGWNQQRADWLHFSPPILKTEYGFFVQDNNPLNFKQVADVKGYRVGVYGPSNTSKSLEKIKAEIGDLTIDLRPDDDSGFRKLSAGRIDAVYSNRDVGRALIAKYALNNIRYAGQHKQLNYYIGFSRQYVDKETVDRFNQMFKILSEKGVILDILNKYSMQPATLD
jgi:polar amino acid transport system substrate-binding protein